VEMPGIRSLSYYSMDRQTAENNKTIGIIESRPVAEITDYTTSISDVLPVVS